MDSNQSASASVYRIDKFIVPEKSHAEFVAKVREMQRFVREVPDCVAENLYEQIAGPGKFNIVTVVEWQNLEALEAAKKTIAQRQALDGFRPSEFIEKLGVTADIAIYRLG